MSSRLERRVRRIERGTTVQLPWNKPASQWTDAQLLEVIGPALNQQYGPATSRPEALMIGVREAPSRAEWAEGYAHNGQPLGEVGEERLRAILTKPRCLRGKMSATIKAGVGP